MNPLTIFIGLVCGLAIGLKLFHRQLFNWLDDHAFLDVPASEANRMDDREFYHHLCRQPVYPARRSIYEEQPSVN